MSGDAYCLDTNGGTSGTGSKIVLFPHDEVPEGASFEDIEPYRLEIALPLTEFLSRFADQSLIDRAKYK
jgi:hypothetical protein